MPAGEEVTRVPLHIDEEEPQSGVARLLGLIRPRWVRHRIQYKVFTDGLTNKLFGCFYKDEETTDVVLVRIYGKKTDLLIDRKLELRNLKLLHRVGLAPRLYAIFENGLAYEYVSGVTLTVNTVIQPKIWKLVARQMARMHSVRLEPEIPCESILWKKSEKFLNLVPNPYSDENLKIKYDKLVNKTISDLKKELQYLKNHLSDLNSPIVFAHNDLLLGNVIYNEHKKKVTFIDYEYTDYNYQAFDIGNHFAEFVGLSEVDYSRYPSKEFQMLWLTEYLETYHNRDVSTNEVEKLYNQVNKFVLATHFFWGLWSLIQAEYSHISFDFLEYAAIRFKEYYDKKDKLLKPVSYS